MVSNHAPAISLRQGDIYFDPTFRYKAGNEAEKLLIVLNKIPILYHPLVVIPVTKQPPSKPVSTGCNPILSVFKVLANTCFFAVDTYVQLGEYKALDYGIFCSKISDNSIRHKYTIPNTFLRQILICFQHQQREVDQDLYDLII